MQQDIELKIISKDIHDKYSIPSYATIGSAALDLYACIDSSIELLPNATCLIPAGIAIYIKDPNIAGVLLPRSGLGHKHGIVLGNLTGLIDADYQGEIKISCWNRGVERYVIVPGTRIAQLMFVPVIKANLKLVDEFTQDTVRGMKGFGHTGIVDIS